MPDNDVSAQIVQAMQKYSEEVVKGIEDGLTSVADEARDKLRETSPRRTGKYAKGWKVQKQEKNGSISLTVHQTGKNAFLTAILENGHRTKKGTFVPGKPHIEAVEQWAAEAAVKAVEKAVKG